MTQTLQETRAKLKSFGIPSKEPIQLKQSFMVSRPMIVLYQITFHEVLISPNLNILGFYMTSFNLHAFLNFIIIFFKPYSFTNKVVNGDVETWIVSVSSKAPVYTLTFSSSFLTASALHPLNLKKVIYGAGDKQGIPGSVSNDSFKTLKKPK